MTEAMVKSTIIMSRLLRWLWLIPALLVMAIVIFAIWIDTAPGHRFVEQQIEQIETKSGLAFQVEGLNGSIYNELTLENIILTDTKGQFFDANNIVLDWFPIGYLGGRLSIDNLVIEYGNLKRLPILNDEGDGPKLPDFDIYIASLNARHITIEDQIMGRADLLSLTGNADIRSGRARLELLLNSKSGNDMADIDIDIEPGANQFKLSADVNAPQDGFLQNISAIKWADKVSLSGNGNWTEWNGELRASLNNNENISLGLKVNNGIYSLIGDINSTVLPRGLLRNISVPILSIDLQGQYENRMVRFEGIANSQNIDLDLKGGYDFSLGGPDALLVDFKLIKPETIVRNLSGFSISGRTRLDGALSNMKVEYLVNGDSVKLGAVGLLNVEAKGEGRRIGRAMRLPIQLTAQNAQGFNPQILDLLRDIRADGEINLAQNILTVKKANVKTNRISGNLDVISNLINGKYDIDLDGKLPSYLFEGFGLADIEGRLNFKPASPQGVNILGVINGQLLRIDNDFMRNITGGLPLVNAKITLGSDAILRFPSFTMQSPLLSFEGGGQRLNDGTFIIDGNGVHGKYGAAKATISGDLSKPKVTLNLDSPYDPLSLENVAISLTPDPSGFVFSSDGQSLLGPFKGSGNIVADQNGDAFVRFDNLFVSDTVAKGSIRNSEAAFIGGFTVRQGGVEGDIQLRPKDGAQQVIAQFDINKARFRGKNAILIRSGKFDLMGVFDGQSSDINATLQAQGISQGNLILGRIAANAKVKNGAGEITASVTGTRGSGFDFTTNIAVNPNRYIVQAKGNYRRKPIRLSRNAIITKNKNVWRLQPARLNYGGGQLTASGRYGKNIFELDALLDTLPLDILDLGDSNLGFGGNASGNIQFTSNGNRPRGDAKLNIKGLTRSGLFLSSQPIDAGLNMKLENSILAARAILSRNKKNVGRLQTKINLRGRGDIIDRVRRGNLFAQMRFDGRADTLWRLTGIELFDLTGDAKIAADARGTINNPQIRGALQTHNARLESGLSGTIISELKTQGRFDGARLRITQMSGNTPDGGSITGRGFFDFTNSNAIGINLNIDAKNALLIDRDDVAARVTGPIKIISSGNGGTISGDIVMNQGRYQLGRANTAEILPDIRIKEINRPDDLPFANRNIIPWQLNLDVKANRGFDVAGLGIESEWSGDFKIGGRIDRPTVGGRADLVRGDYDFAGRVFNLARGAIVFDGRNPPNPQIDIVAEALLNGVDARIEVRGRSFSPAITFTSTPTLPQEELLARLLFGTSVLELSAAEAIQLSSAIAGLQSGGLDPINAIRKAVGLDRLRFVSANAATGQGTGIAVGKFIGRRTFVELVTDGRGYSATQAEFQITRWLALLSSISTLGEQGVNAKVSRDY